MAHRMILVLGAGMLLPGLFYMDPGPSRGWSLALKPAAVLGPCEGGSIGTDPLLDSDQDSIPDVVEGNSDFDRDSYKDACDPDDDNDGLPSLLEESFDANGDGLPDPDIDGDAQPNRLDLDSDNDRYSDSREWLADLDGDGLPDFADVDSQADVGAGTGGSSGGGGGGGGGDDDDAAGDDDAGGDDDSGGDDDDSPGDDDDDSSGDDDDPGDDDSGDDDSGDDDVSPPPRHGDSLEIAEGYYVGNGGCSTAGGPAGTTLWMALLALAMRFLRRGR